jgi:hypothetical protein
MQFTPDQLAELERQKAADPGARHFRFVPTPEQAAELMAEGEQAESERSDLEAIFRRIVAASEEEGFSGWLRRAIRRARQPVEEIARRSQIDAEVLTAFRTGESTLPSDAVDRLVATLGLQLVDQPASR